jgi:hypothetical protein
VFSTAFELRGVDVPFFSGAGHKILKKGGNLFLGVKNVLLLNFDGL